MPITDDAVFAEDPGLSWSQLRAFIGCARYRSFNAAAAGMGLTSAAVRYQIGLLEHRLGARLFQRRSGELTLTEAGASFAHKVEAPMQQLVAACAEATSSADSGVMMLTAPPLFARQFLFGSKLQSWCDAHRIQLDITDIKRDLFAQQPVAAIRLGAADHPDLCSTNLLLCVNVIIAAAPSIAKAARPLDAAWWAEQVLLNTSITDAGWLRAWSALGLKLPKPLRTLLFSSYAAALEAAASGQGVILAPLPFAQRELSSGRLAQVSEVRLSSKYDYALVMQKGAAMSARGRALRQRVVSEIAAELGK